MILAWNLCFQVSQVLLLFSVRSELEPVQLRHWVGSEWPWKMHFVFNQLCLLRVDAGSGFGMLW